MKNSELLARMRRAWTVAGERLFAGPNPPTRAEAIEAASWALFSAFEGTSLTDAALVCKTGRKIVRETLHRMGGYFRGRATRVVDYDAEPDLGVVPDRILAEKHGVSRHAVSQARQRRGIVAARFTGKAKAA
jgi:hypothetical protein